LFNVASRAALAYKSVKQMRMSVMSKDVVGSMPKGNSEWDVAWNAVHRLDAARRGIHDGGDRGAAARANSEEIARDIAEIERATAALRKAAPALEVWTDRPSDQAPVAHKPRSVWILVGVLWLSTALVTAGALAAIAALVG
jgi:hypothetical protein